MDVSAMYMTNRYQKIPYSLGTNVSKTKVAEAASGTHETRSNMRQQLKALRDIEDGNESKTSFAMKNDVAVKSAKTYADSLREQREKARDTSLSKQKLKYQFKDISSKIIRSKTSTAARQVVGQAQREVLRIKKAAASGKYDADEIENALEHAKAMERVAKKKVKNLVAEEMAKASGRMSDVQELTDNEGAGRMAESDDMANSTEINDYASMSSLNDEFSGEMLEEFEDAMKEMLEETGLEDLADSIITSGEKATPEDIKELQIKHRNKEMKDIVKADAEYLKTLADSFSSCVWGEYGV